MATTPATDPTNPSLYDAVFAGPDPRTTQPVGAPVVGPSVPTTPSATPAPATDNQSRFLAMLNSGQYANPQAAIDAFNALGLSADGTGLSSQYGSSPAYYSNGNTIGLPGAYLTQQSDGTWAATPRSASPASAPTLAPIPLSPTATPTPATTASPTAATTDTLTPSYLQPPSAAPGTTDDAVAAIRARAFAGLQPNPSA